MGHIRGLGRDRRVLSGVDGVYLCCLEHYEVRRGEHEGTALRMR